MPVAIAPVNRDLHDFFQRRDQRPVLIVNGAPTIEMIIMFRDFEHAFAWNIASAQNIFQKWNDVLMLFGTTERYNQQRIVAGHDSIVRL